MTDSSEETFPEPEDSQQSVVISPSGSAGTTVPAVVEFAYNGFTTAGDKWKATCTRCNKTLTESRGVTSAFTR